MAIQRRSCECCGRETNRKYMCSRCDPSPRSKSASQVESPSDVYLNGEAEFSSRKIDDTPGTDALDYISKRLVSDYCPTRDREIDNEILDALRREME